MVRFEKNVSLIPRTCFREGEELTVIGHLRNGRDGHMSAEIYPVLIVYKA